MLRTLSLSELSSQRRAVNLSSIYAESVSAHRIGQRPIILGRKGATEALKGRKIVLRAFSA